MRRETLGGTALIAGALMMLVTMALHPTHRDLARDSGGMGALSLAVHALALAATPMLCYGAFALTRRLTPGGALSELALAFFGVGAIASLLAATASGFLATDLIARIAASDGEARLAAEAVGRYNAGVNQAYAKILVAASSLAIGLWSIEILRTRLMRRGTGVLGCIVASLTLLAFFSGRLRLDVHGFGAVVLGQAVWFVMAGVEMRGRTGHPESPDLERA